MSDMHGKAGDGSRRLSGSDYADQNGLGGPFCGGSRPPLRWDLEGRALSRPIISGRHGGRSSKP